MRQLRIVGVDPDASTVECEDTGSGERFGLPLDERLRAAARGESPAPSDRGRPAVTGSMRPREIQDRIRHGASPEDVAAEAGVPLSRIEGFAVPVLLERATAAEMARGAHPVLADGPALDTLADRVEEGLGRIGIDPDQIRWDAWRDRSGGWVVRTSWPAGLSEDAAATWSFVRDSHGGAARALDDEARRILDPSSAAALRTVPAAPPVPAGPPPIRAVAPPAEPTGLESVRPDRRPPEVPTVPGTPAAIPVSPVPAAQPGPTGAPSPDDEGFLRNPPAHPERRGSRRHPTMPSWEDVLLGVRGKDD